MNKIQLKLDPGKVVYRVTAEDTEIVIVYKWPDDSDFFYGTVISVTGATEVGRFKKERYKEFTGEITFTCKSEYKKEEKGVLTADSFKNKAIKCLSNEQLKSIIRLAESVGIVVKFLSSYEDGYYFLGDEELFYSNYSSKWIKSTHQVILYSDFINLYK